MPSPPRVAGNRPRPAGTTRSSHKGTRIVRPVRAGVRPSTGARSATRRAPVSFVRGARTHLARSPVRRLFRRTITYPSVHPRAQRVMVWPRELAVRVL